MQITDKWRERGIIFLFIMFWLLTMMFGYWLLFDWKGFGSLTEPSVDACYHAYGHMCNETELLMLRGK